MSPRKRSSQTAHDTRVRQEAERLRRDGWTVRADLRGYESPEPIGEDGRVPDVEAVKQGAKRIIEVETPHTVGAHEEQQQTFRRSAAQQPRTTFDTVLTKKPK